MKKNQLFGTRGITSAKHEHDVDVVIIGGGINGAGLFRDLCAQGVTCLLVDKGDFGSGTSAAPSRLIHGGLKYLETGELGLVAQSALERNLLLKNAAHLVKPLETFIPVFSWTRGIYAALRTLFGSTTAPRSRGAVLIKIGLAMYDFYGARHRVMPRHRLLGRKRALQEMPAITTSIVAVGAYHDAMITHPERLVLELIMDGLDASQSSSAVNYTGIHQCKGGLITFKRYNNDAFSVRPQIVVNAAGPWIDQVNMMLGAPSEMIGGTKGSHILLKHDELVKNLAGRMIYFEADDGRICLVFDYLGLAMVGSTDTAADDPDDVCCESEEIDYFLDSVRVLLPELQFEHDQVVYAYSGIRPLPASNALIPGLISRDHSAPIAEADNQHAFPIISLIGGKWTTFRGFAEEVADVILERFERARVVSTQSLPIGGGKEFPQDTVAWKQWVKDATTKTGFAEDRVVQLLERYGSSASRITDHRGQWSDDIRLRDSSHYSFSEIDYIVRNECVEHLLDVILRRTTLAITASLTMYDLQQISIIAEAALGWDAKRTHQEVQDVVQQLSEQHRMHL